MAENPGQKNSWLAENRNYIFYTVGGVIVFLLALVSYEQFKQRRIRR